MTMLSNRFFPFNNLAANLASQLPRTIDGSHDHSHLFRVWNNAKAIQTKEGGNLKLVAAAVLLHDCVLIPKDSPQRSQASQFAAEEATRILQSLNWPIGEIEIVAGAIRTHSYSANLTLTSLEGRILQDADRLDAIGYTGIARCFYTAGRMSSQLYDPADPTASARSLDDNHYALDHFPQKLLKLAANFTTATGKTLADARARALEAFYEGMLTEITAAS